MNPGQTVQSALARLNTTQKAAFAAICATRILKEIRDAGIEEVDSYPDLENGLKVFWEILGQTRPADPAAIQRASGAAGEALPQGEDAEFDLSVDCFSTAVSLGLAILISPKDELKYATTIGFSAVDTVNNLFDEHDRVRAAETQWQLAAIDLLAATAAGPLSPALFSSIPEYDRGPRNPYYGE